MDPTQCGDIGGSCNSRYSCALSSDCCCQVSTTTTVTTTTTTVPSNTGCQSNEDCPSGYVCNNGICEAENNKACLQYNNQTGKCVQWTGVYDNAKDAAYYETCTKTPRLCDKCKQTAKCVIDPNTGYCLVDYNNSAKGNYAVWVDTDGDGIADTSVVGWSGGGGGGGGTTTTTQPTTTTTAPPAITTTRTTTPTTTTTIPLCGNGYCNYPTENQKNCPQDCYTTLKVYTEKNEIVTPSTTLLPNQTLRLVLTFNDSRYDSSQGFNLKLFATIDENIWDISNGCKACGKNLEEMGCDASKRGHKKHWHSDYP